MEKFDLIVIGGGRASNLVMRASEIGKKVALIEKDRLGGACPNNGCVPSKLLIGYAHVARAIKESSRHFIDAKINSIDTKSIFHEVNDYVTKVDARYESRFNENITLFRGEGFFESDSIINVNGEKLTAPVIVIGTGSRPKKVPFENAWTSNDIFPLKGDIPNSITIVGAGFIACELANFFDAVGIETKLIVRSQKLLSNEDEDISDIFKKEFCKNVNVQFDTTITNAIYKNKQFEIELEKKDKTITTYKSDALLYAIGRESNTDTLKLENTSIQIDSRGYIKRDKDFQTDAKGVYVVGDAAGDYMLQHAASHEVNHLFKILYENANSLHFKYMPHAVFTEPEIASVGYTEEQLQEKNIPYVSSITNWLASAKAMSTRLEYPRIKMLVDPTNYKILGCHMIGPDSATMMHQVLAVMNIDNDIRYLKDMLYIHPALSEALLPASVEVVKKVQNYNS